MTVKKLAFAAAAGALLLSAVAAYADTTAKTYLNQNGTSGDVTVVTREDVTKGGSVLAVSGDVSNGALVGTVAAGSHHSDVYAKSSVNQNATSGDVKVITKDDVSKGGSVTGASGNVSNEAGVFTGAFSQSH